MYFVTLFSRVINVHACVGQCMKSPKPYVIIYSKESIQHTFCLRNLMTRFTVKYISLHRQIIVIIANIVIHNIRTKIVTTVTALIFIITSMCYSFIENKPWKQESSKV